MPKVAFLLCLVVILAALIVRSDPAGAANVTVTYGGNSAQLGIEFEGTITPGDADRLFEALKQVKAANKLLAGISVNSPGGNFAEAIKIAQGLYEAKVAGTKHAVIVFSNHVCASACFLIFACAPQRYADITARIGVHSARNAKDNSEDVGSYAVDTWMGRMSKQCGIPDYLVGKMITTRADSMYWLTTQDLSAMGVHVMQNGYELSPPAPQTNTPAPSPTLPKCNERMRLGCALYALGGGDVFYCMRQKALLYGCHW